MHVPMASKVTVAPDAEQTAPVNEVKVTASPEEAVALTVKGALPRLRLKRVPKLMVCGSFATVKLRLTFGAAAYVELPACDAWIVQVPGATMVTVFPPVVQTLVVSEAKVTGSPDVAVAESANRATPKVTFAMAANVIVCVPADMVTLNDCVALGGTPLLAVSVPR